MAAHNFLCSDFSEEGRYVMIKTLNETAPLLMYYFYCFFFNFVVDMPTNQEIYGHTSKQACGWSKQTGV